MTRRLFCLLLALACAPIAHAQNAPSTAFVGVTVLPMTGPEVLTNRTVVVRDGRIVAITPATTKPPAGAVQIDARGKFLMPGLSEMHAHIPGANAPAQLIQDIMYLYVANGVTTIRGMLGAPNQLVLRDRAARNEIIAPTIIVGAPSLNGNTASTPEAAATLVAQNIAAGYDLQKVHPGFGLAAYDSAFAVARRSNFKFAGHVPTGVGLDRALEARQDIDHLDGYMEAATPPDMQARIAHPTDQVSMAEVFASIDNGTIPALVRRTREAGIYNAPTMYLWDNLYGATNPDSLALLPEMKYAPRQWVQNWINQKRQRLGFDAQNNVTDAHRAQLLGFRRLLIKALADGGALLMLGTDSPQMFNVPGFALHREVTVLSQAGLTPYQILVSGTANVGRYTREVLGKTDAFGTVQVGQRADLVLLDGNPLQDLRNLQRRAGVMVRGRWFDAKTLQAGLDEIAARNAQ
jgi:imidazolonepropionase-like amidohydrolase